ncbi:ATP-dependent zinc metalloprotease FtsH [Amphiplicatus metriothermophilus]|uniref:ATP-dependent zinc metalloprotease FtsH n=1 Tax=Amphiplicatus metriothermophilus TaxID=1519374 RepID=A0A239PZI6_9PROT|nr:ATP-dependent zinc metalloprotease FtsH [Amphiplicatus metriothermophilus]MBB5518180.1 cell division protease FtsH [Amphiplicatus metriothermophilus]SNT75342.1 membrane protease FtsH catalytic subunit [Amphiplicatus metriothermophilus]
MNGRNILIWGLVFIFFIIALQLFEFSSPGPTVERLSYSQFVTRIDEGAIRQAEIDGVNVKGALDNGRQFVAAIPEGAAPQIADRLIAAGAETTITPVEELPLALSLLFNILPFLIFLAFIFFVMRQMQGAGGKAMGFGKSRAKLLTERQGRVTFDDVAGIDEAKEELEEIVEYLKDPMKFQRLGGKIPKGALLVGPPGTGKTLLARAIAGEANVPFFTISGSDFVEMFVGVGASRVRDMFEQAKKNAPCIIFIDEIDAVGRHRGAGLGGGNDEREQTLNQLLVEMDGFEANEGIILIAATNRPDVLDPALLRPGRFDRQVVVPNPDVVGREKILQVHAKKVPLAPDVDLRTIARGTPGFSGADLANLVNEAALLAARRGKRFVTAKEFDDSKDKVLMGAERRSMVMTEEEKMLTAYHEAGHALVGITVPGNDPVHKATIIPRGRALGMVQYLPERDRYSMTLQQMQARIAMAMGGRVAEELKFGREKVTSGAQQDIEHATKIARAMVTQYGLSEKLGPIAYAEDEGEVFLGQSIARTKSISPDTAKLIEDEIKRFVMEGYETARRILTERRDDWERLAQALLEYETLTGEEIQKLLKGEPIVREEPEDFAASPPSSVPTTGAGADKERKGPEGFEPSPQGA